MALAAARGRHAVGERGRGHGAERQQAFGQDAAETVDGADVRTWAASSLMPANCQYKAIVRPAAADRPYEDLRMFRGSVHVQGLPVKVP